MSYNNDIDIYLYKKNHVVICHRKGIMKNKIAIIYSGFMSEYINEFLNLCKEHTIKVDMIFFPNNFYENKLINKTFFLKSKLNIKDINSKKETEEEIKKLININDYDYIIFDGYSGLSFSCNIFHNNTLNYRIKTHSNYLYRKILQIGHYRKLMAEKTYYKNCPKLIAVSEELKKDLVNNCNVTSNKIEVIHPGYSKFNIEEEIRNIKPDKNRKFIIGCVTCGFSTKGGYIVLGALRELVKRNKVKNIEVRFINPKFDKQLLLKMYIKLFGLEKDVKFYPYQNDIKKFYTELDCLVCASKCEAFGRVVTEAMLFYIPVIAASNIGACDIIKDGENGFIYTNDRKRYANLADKLEELILNYDYYEYIKQKAYNTAINITWENFGRKLFFSLYSFCHKSAKETI